MSFCEQLIETDFHSVVSLFFCHCGKGMLTFERHRTLAVVVVASAIAIFSDFIMQSLNQLGLHKVVVTSCFCSICTRLPLGLDKRLALVDVSISDHNNNHDRQDDNHRPTELVLGDLVEEGRVVGVHVGVEDQDENAHEDLDEHYVRVEVEARLLQLQLWKDLLHVFILDKQSVERAFDAF